MTHTTSLQRSEMMSRIRGANTKPEILLRKALFARGFRYRLHDRRLPGRPDIVFSGRQAAIFINGCFWHGHTCDQFRWPKSNVEFWRQKITGNKKRDSRNIKALLENDWRVLVVWECALRRSNARNIDEVADYCATWLRSTRSYGEIKARLPRKPRR